MKMPNDKEQFEALANGTIYDLVVKYVGPPPLPKGAYERIFNVSKAEFIKWLRKNYKLKNLPFVYLTPSNKDGYYIIREGGLFYKYRTYYQERLVRLDECVVSNLEKVYEKYAEHCLKYSGTGLPFEWWDKNE